MGPIGAHRDGRRRARGWLVRAFARQGFLILGLLVLVAGVASSESQAAAANPLTWSTPTLADHSHDGFTGLTGIACPSGTLCVGIDNQGSALTSTDPADAANATWVAKAVDVHSQNDTPTGISCPDSTLCVLVDNNGDSVTTTNPANGSSASWSSPAQIDSTQFAGLDAISCPDEQLCVAVDSSGNAVTSLDPSAAGSAAWVTHSVGNGGHRLTGVSCPAENLCVAVDSSGNAVISTDPQDAATATWTVHQLTGNQNDGLNAVACPTITLCLAVDNRGNVFTTSDPADATPTWTTENIDGTNTLSAISCVGSSLCVVLDGTKHALASTDPADAASASWGAASAHASRAVSCPSTSLCVAASGNDFATSTNPGAGAAATWVAKSVDGQGTSLFSMSCARSGSLCAATDAFGNVVAITTDPADGGAATWTLSTLPNGASAQAVSCPSASLCVVVGNGRAFTSTDPADGAGAKWAAETIDTGAGIPSISCPTTTLCVAVGAAGHALITTDPGDGANATWSNTDIDATNFLFHVTCASSTLCVAADGINTAQDPQHRTGGQVLITTDPSDGANATWSTQLISPSGLGAVSCAPDGNLCVAGSQGKTLTSTDPADGAHSTWQTGSVLSGGFGIVEDIACPSDTLCVADMQGESVATSTDPADGTSATWSTQQIDFPEQPSGSPGLSAISCAASELCATDDDEGRAMIGLGAAAPHTLSVSLAGTGSGTVSGQGISCPGTCSGMYPDGTQVTLSATPASGDTFTGWSGACSGTGTCQVTMSQDQQVTANFAAPQTPQKTLTVDVTGPGSVSGSGISCPGTCQQSYPQGTVISLTATPATGAVFTGWSGACTGTGDCTITLDNDTSVTASFAPAHALSAAVAGTGSGTVSGPGIACPGTCSGSYPAGTQVTLTATPASGSTFTGWSGACSGAGACQVTMSQDQQVTANFTRNAAAGHALSVALAGAGHGTVAGQGISCPPTCGQTYPPGTQVTLTATPTSGSTFTGWSGACTGTGPCTVTLDNDRAVTATFTPVGFPTLHVTLAGNGSGRVSGPQLSCAASCDQAYAPGSAVTLDAVPGAGSHFAGWSGACTGTGACTITLDGDRSVTATFTTALAGVAGVVRDGSQTADPPVGGASLVVCEESYAACALTKSAPDGHYSAGGLRPGSYNIEVFPPAGSSLEPGSAAVTISAGTTPQDFDLQPPVPLSSGVSFGGTTNGVSSSGVPSVYWTSPFSFTDPVSVPATATPGATLIFDVIGGLIDSSNAATGAPPTGLAGEQIFGVRYDSRGHPADIEAASSPDLPAPPIGVQWGDTVAAARDAHAGAGTAHAPRTRPTAQAASGGPVAHTAFQLSIPLPAPDAVSESANFVIDPNTGAGGSAYEVYPFTITVSARPTLRPPEDVHPLVKKFAKWCERYIPQIKGTVRGRLYHDHLKKSWYYTLDSEGFGPGGVPLKTHELTGDPGDYLSQAFNQFAQAAQGRARDVPSPGSGLVGRAAQAGSENLRPFPGAGALRIQPFLHVGAANVVGSDGKGGLKVNDTGGGPIAVEFQVPSLQSTVHGAVQWFTYTTVSQLDSPQATNSGPRAGVAQALDGDVGTPDLNCGSVYIDPSGRVVTKSGRPIARAKVVLAHSASRHGAFTMVPSGSALMSPANRRNPDHTSQLGLFGWDVMPGFYEVFASHPGCRAAGPGGRRGGSGVLTVPPAVLDLRLVLDCPHLTYRPSRISLRATQAASGGRSIAMLLARVRAGRGSPRPGPSGVVTFWQGRRLLGSAALEPRTGTATLAAPLRGGGGKLSVRYAGDGIFAPSSASVR